MLGLLSLAWAGEVCEISIIIMQIKMRLPAFETPESHCRIMVVRGEVEGRRKFLRRDLDVIFINAQTNKKRARRKLLRDLRRECN